MEARHTMFSRNTVNLPATREREEGTTLSYMCVCTYNKLDVVRMEATVTLPATRERRRNNVIVHCTYNKLYVVRMEARHTMFSRNTREKKEQRYRTCVSTLGDGTWTVFLENMVSLYGLHPDNVTLAESWFRGSLRKSYLVVSPPS